MMVEIVNDVVHMSEAEFQFVWEYAVQHADDPMATVKAFRAMGMPEHDIAELRRSLRSIDVRVVHA
jgi:hypothetical protein